MAPAQNNAVPFGLTNQSLQRFQIQTAVSGMGFAGQPSGWSCLSKASSNLDHGIKAFAKQVDVSAALLLGLHENLPENGGCQKIGGHTRSSRHFPIFAALLDPCYLAASGFFRTN